MRRLLAVTVLLVAAGLSWSAPASACSVSGPPPTDAQYLAMADVVFEGTAIGRHDPNAGAPVVASGELVLWTFAVDRPIKGSVGLQQTVASARSSVSCGFEFSLGTRYRVYGSYEGALLRTSSPSGTRAAPLVAAVTTTVPPVHPPAPGSPPRRIALTG